MSSDETRGRAGLDRALLLAEAEQAALGWGYLTVDGFVIGSEPDLERYLQALEAFRAVAAGRESRYQGTSSRLTFAIRGEAAAGATRSEDASERIAELHDRLDELSTPGLFGTWWDIRDGAR